MAIFETSESLSCTYPDRGCGRYPSWFVGPARSGYCPKGQGTGVVLGVVVVLGVGTQSVRGDSVIPGTVNEGGSRTLEGS
eukprot:753561-Hanusia_phi.AAC.6